VHVARELARPRRQARVWVDLSLLTIKQQREERETRVEIVDILEVLC
jgi:hypothetical protein